MLTLLGGGSPITKVCQTQCVGYIGLFSKQRMWGEVEEGAAVQYWASEDHRIGETSPEKGHKCGMHHMEERQDLQPILLLTGFSRMLSAGDMGKLYRWLVVSFSRKTQLELSSWYSRTI